MATLFLIVATGCAEAEEDVLQYGGRDLVNPAEVCEVVDRWDAVINHRDYTGENLERRLARLEDEAKILDELRVLADHTVQGAPSSDKVVDLLRDVNGVSERNSELTRIYSLPAFSLRDRNETLTEYRWDVNALEVLDQDCGRFGFG